MTTKVYGASDDLIEFEGDFNGEFYLRGTGEEESVLLVFSDGTLLKAWYGKDGMGIWAIRLVKRGALFDRTEECVDEDTKPHSDVAYFQDGIKWVYAASKWERVR